MDLSIIIPSFNTKVLLERCLNSVYGSLKSTKLSYEIIVVDNDSDDGSRELLNKKYPRVIKIFNKTNLGFSKANNIGISRAKSKYILLLNSDIQVLDQSIEKLMLFIQNHPRSFAGGKLLNENGTPQASSGPMYTLPVVAAMLFAKGDNLGLTRYSPDEVRQVNWVSGACLLGSKQAFLEVGLFDEQIFMYMEEIDLLYRAAKLGYTTFFTPSAKFIHSGAASSQNRKKPVINIYRGLLYFYRKHRSIMELRILKIMLLMKAKLAIAIGKLIGNELLVTTYEQALQMV